MRYIRTKDKIYDGSLFLREYTGWYFNEKSKLYAFTENEIVKQADIIEELCDEFVCVGNGDNDDSNRKDIYDELTERIIDTYKIIYGAIWTGKGLIYVAKMNESGELKLL